MSRANYRQQSAWETMTDKRYQLNEIYIHETDERILKMLRFMTTKEEVRAQLDKNIRNLYGDFIISNRIVTHDWMPRVYEVIEYCASTLHIGIPYVVIPKELAGDSTAFTIGTDEYAYIFLSPQLTANLSRNELTFLIGHECGHIALEHVMYHSIQSLPLRMGSVNLQALAKLLSGLRYAGSDIQKNIKLSLEHWKYRSEISVDRAGLLCSRDLEASCHLLVKIYMNDATLSTKQLNRYLEAFQFTIDDYASKSFELHPKYSLLHQRIVCLKLFANSQAYHKLIGESTENTLLYDDIQLFNLIEYVLQATIE